MITLLIMAVLALYGYRKAKSLGGNKQDIALYIASFSLAGFALGMILSVILDNLI